MSACDYECWCEYEFWCVAAHYKCWFVTMNIGLWQLMLVCAYDCQCASECWYMTDKIINVGVTMNVGVCVYECWQCMTMTMNVRLWPWKQVCDYECCWFVTDSGVPVWMLGYGEEWWCGYECVWLWILVFVVCNYECIIGWRQSIFLNCIAVQTLMLLSRYTCMSHSGESSQAIYNLFYKHCNWCKSIDLPEAGREPDDTEYECTQREWGDEQLEQWAPELETQKWN